MRLLSTHTLKLETFPDRHGKTPCFAILSHCWSENADDEVSFADIQNGKVTSKKAHTKVMQAMKQAREAPQHYDYIWIDTCCINKDSSAELSEAINSMFTWYAAADVCYAYMEDVSFSVLPQMKNSKWFTRGWTLQELIAPKDVIFFDREWKRIGARSFVAIRDLVVEQTGVAAEILTGERALASLSVAQRMSWSAKRNVTRPEDRAYCMMGIFEVNMPMLYGEGGVNAFHRLQEQIMKDSDDQSIFAWSCPEGTKIPELHGLLADTPDWFVDRHKIVAYADWEGNEPYQLSNRGLKIDLALADIGNGEYLAALNCPVPHPDKGYHSFLGIKLKRLASGFQQYARVECQMLYGLEERQGDRTTIYVRQKAFPEDNEAIMPWHFFQPRRLQLPRDQYRLLKVAHFPIDKGSYTPRPVHSTWLAAAQASSFQIIKHARCISAVMYFRRETDGRDLVLVLGSIEDLQVGFAIGPDTPECSIAEMERLCHLEPVGTTLDGGTHRVRVDATIIIQPPAKIYVLDLTVDGQMQRVYVPPTQTSPISMRPQELMEDVLDDVVEDVKEVATNARYRPMSVFRRLKAKSVATQDSDTQRLTDSLPIYK